MADWGFRDDYGRAVSAKVLRRRAREEAKRGSKKDRAAATEAGHAKT